MGTVSDVTIVNLEAKTVLGIRRRGKYREIRRIVRELVEYCQNKGTVVNGPPFYLSHEATQEESMKADKEGTADLEVAVPVGGEPAGTGDIRCYRIDGGKMAMVSHKGAYKECGLAFVKLHAWIAQNNITVTGPIREVYLNDPSETKPEELLTEIYAPIGP